MDKKLTEWQLFKNETRIFFLAVKYCLLGEAWETALYNAQVIVNAWKGKVVTYSKYDEEDM